ncbi:hypothetical protein EKO27_g7149 [Xylaria grammica]|uniref:Uncharacterized protein n=1 Tax=Xylaria grammica TaxID=363999 RepID=A0A439D0G5_9PEZI|nr:hypothetical protein EKO27_g7149 [Xylaria grammica]
MVAPELDAMSPSKEQMEAFEGFSQEEILYLAKGKRHLKALSGSGSGVVVDTFELTEYLTLVDGNSYALLCATVRNRNSSRLTNTVAPPTVVLITSTTRGVGEGILKPYLLKPNHVIISANRDSRNAAYKALLDLPTAEGIKHIITNIDCDVPTVLTTVADVKAEDIQKHINTNAYGFIHLSQALKSTLKRSESPVCATVGSRAAWLTV